MKSIIAGRYSLIKKIGNGSFGEVYKSIDLYTNSEVAIKLESIHSRHPQLEHEARVYKLLQGGVGIPNIYWSGVAGERVAMVIDMLGPSLEDLFNYTRKKFSVKTILMIAEQMIQRIEYFHAHHFLHRDVKPDNFLVGLDKMHEVIYIIDYGLASGYWNPINSEHIPYRENKNLTGTARYASLNTHMGIEQSRRDDLECIGYLLLYFLRGSLPWQGLKASTQKKRYQAIRNVKAGTSIEVLCKGFPAEFAAYIKYCRGLQFFDMPDYAYLKKLLRNLFVKCEYKWDYSFDWLLPPSDSRSVQSTEASRTFLEEAKERPKEERQINIRSQKRFYPFARCDKEVRKYKDVFVIFQDNKKTH